MTEEDNKEIEYKRLYVQLGISKKQIESEINNIISIPSEELNKLFITDKNELYIRTLINRINICKKYLKGLNEVTYDFDTEIQIAILDGNKDYIIKEYLYEKDVIKEMDSVPSTTFKLLEKVVKTLELLEEE